MVLWMSQPTYVSDIMVEARMEYKHVANGRERVEWLGLVPNWVLQ